MGDNNKKSTVMTEDFLNHHCLLKQTYVVEENDIIFF
jgi:hypothetical protein